MRATLEPHSGTLRIGEAHEKHGDEYEWACTVTFQEGGVAATLHGASKPPTPAIWRAGRECLRALGVKVVRFERRGGGKIRHKREYWL